MIQVPLAPQPVETPKWLMAKGSGSSQERMGAASPSRPAMMTPSLQRTQKALNSSPLRIPPVATSTLSGFSRLRLMTLLVLLQPPRNT